MRGSGPRDMDHHAYGFDFYPVFGADDPDRCVSDLVYPRFGGHKLPAGITL